MILDDGWATLRLFNAILGLLCIGAALGNFAWFKNQFPALRVMLFGHMALIAANTYAALELALSDATLPGGIRVWAITSGLVTTLVALMLVEREQGTLRHEASSLNDIVTALQKPPLDRIPDPPMEGLSDAADQMKKRHEEQT